MGGREHGRVRPFLGMWRAQAIFCAILFVLIAVASPSGAKDERRPGPRLNYIRDAEIEHDLRIMLSPIMQAAGLEPEAVRFILVQDNVINAFVAGGMNVFVFTGLIQKTDTADQLIGVMAHELGHIAGGHLVRGTEAARNASIEAIIGMVAGVAVGVLAGNSEAGIAAIGGAQELAQRNFFSFSRTQEGSADAAALRFLDSAGWSAQGFLDFMKKLQGQEYLPNSRQTQYVITHPLTPDRVDAVNEHVTHSEYSKHQLDPLYGNLHARIKAKLLGFLQPHQALLRYSENDTDFIHRYARAIALYRTNKLEPALALTDKLIAAEPANPFLQELRGQMLYEFGRTTEAITAYRLAVKGEPHSALLRAALGQALLQSRDVAANDEAVTNLLEAVRLEPATPSVWRGLATAWGRDGKSSALADYALAEEALAAGDTALAHERAARALKKLPANSPYRVRAQDIQLVKNDAK